MRWLKQQLRQKLRKQRRLLSPFQQHHYAEQIAKRLFQQTFYQKAKHIALYMAFEGEVSTIPILKMALQNHKFCYIPVLTQPCLQFTKIDLQTPMTKNALGILEPSSKTLITISPRKLDIVLMPLVAFDKHGHRLGMGGGYYDKTFAFRKRAIKPHLVGLAYDFQRISWVMHSALDVPLDEIITENRVYFTD